MNEHIDEAKEELKRADHIIYVSLKYTRTADVMKGAIQRLINAFDFGVYSLLQTLKDENKIEEIPTPPAKRVQAIKEYFPNDRLLCDYLDFYIMLRKINKEPYKSFKEFRRHVMMVLEYEKRDIEINIDIITEYFHRTKEFVNYIQALNKDD